MLPRFLLGIFLVFQMKSLNWEIYDIEIVKTKRNKPKKNPKPHFLLLLN